MPVALSWLYDHSPYPARVAMASARGFVLRSHRFDRQTELIADEAIERERWPVASVRQWQEEKVQDLLDVAVTSVPAYRSIRDRPAGATLRLGEFPLLTKQQLRAAPTTFLRDDLPKRLIHEHTSGTTGTPMSLWLSRSDYRYWYALSEARWRRWYGVTRHDRWAIIGGQQVVPSRASAPPYWVWNAAMHQLYLSSYHVADRTASAYVSALDSHRVNFLLGYPSSIHALAIACNKHGIRPRPLKTVIANAEPVLDHQRSAIRDVFGCEIRETYGMAEYVAAASECEHGRLHLWPEAGLVEVVDMHADHPVAVGETGRLVCTGLVNTTMPLVRYLVGDAGSLRADTDTCPCGRTLPALTSVEGRCDDLVHTIDGRVIGRLDPVFKGDLPIAAAQIIQEALDEFRVLVVPDDGYGPKARDSITSRLRARVGDVQVWVEEVDALPTGPNGKVKAVVSHIDLSSRVPPSTRG